MLTHGRRSHGSSSNSSSESDAGDEENVCAGWGRAAARVGAVGPKESLAVRSLVLLLESATASVSKVGRGVWLPSWLLGL